MCDIEEPPARRRAGQVRRAFAQVECNTDGSAATLVGPTWSEPSERWGARQITDGAPRGSR